MIMIQESIFSLEVMLVILQPVRSRDLREERSTGAVSAAPRQPQSTHHPLQPWSQPLQTALESYFNAVKLLYLCLVQSASV